MEEIKIYAILSFVLMMVMLFTAFWGNKLIIFRRVVFAGSVILSYLPFINRLAYMDLNGSWLVVSIISSGAGLVSMTGFVLVQTIDPNGENEVSWPYLIWVYPGLIAFGMCLGTAIYLFLS